MTLYKRISLAVLILLFSRLALAGELKITYESYLKKSGVLLDTQSLLTAVSTNANSQVRSYAVGLLGLRREKAAVPVLHTALTSEQDEDVRCSLAAVLLQLEGPAAYEIARAVVEKTENPNQRLLLAGSEADAGDDSGFPIVASALSASDQFVRFWAVDVLPRFIHPERFPDVSTDALNLLLGKTVDPSPTVREEVARRLAQVWQYGVRDPRLRLALQHLAASDADSVVRREAATGLIEIEKNGGKE